MFLVYGPKLNTPLFDYLELRLYLSLHGIQLTPVELNLFIFDFECRLDLIDYIKQILNLSEFLVEQGILVPEDPPQLSVVIPLAVELLLVLLILLPDEVIHLDKVGPQVLVLLM